MAEQPLVARIHAALATEDRRAFIDPSDLDAMAVDVALALQGVRLSGDRQLPPPYDTLSAEDRSVWLVLEGLYDGSLTDDVRRANAGRDLTAWADLKPDAQQALSSMLLQIVQVCHAVALNPAAHRDGPTPPPLPHSRACGITPHEHGAACAVDCPTCGPQAPGLVSRRG